MLARTKTKIEIVSDVIAGLGVLVVFGVTLAGGANYSRSKPASAAPANVITSPATIVGSNIQFNGSILSSDSPVTSAGFQITDDPSFATFYPFYTTTLLNSFGYEGTGDGQLGYTPQGVTLDSSGNIYVADTTNNRIQKFNSSGVYQSKFGSTGTGNGQFSSPRGVAVDSSGNIYVSEYTNKRVQIFNSAGVYQRKFTSSNNPTGLALDSSGNIYVSNMNTEVIKYSSLGVQLAVYNNANFGNRGCSGNNYTSVAVDSSGNIYAAIAGCKISKIDSAGNLLRYFVTDEYDGVYFDGSNVIAVDSNQNIYAVGGYSANDPHAFVFSGTVPVGGINTTKWGGEYCDTTYYYKAFATNSSGTTYGEALSFNFPCMEVSTLAATTDSTTTATLNGNISNNLLFYESARGFEWGTDTSYGNDLADAGLPPFFL